MRRAAAILLVWAGPALSEPCVGPNFDRPLPGASNVERRTSDVPTARYPGIWQEGRVAGFAYQLASDLSAVLSDSLDAPSWQIAIECGNDGGCTRSGDAAPDAAIPVADALQRCLLGQEVAAADFAIPTARGIAGLPEDAGVTDPERAIDSVAGIATAAGIESAANAPSSTAPAPNDDPERPAAVRDVPAPEAQPDPALVDLGPSVQPDRECRLQLITPGTSTVQTLQRLLIEAGQDPGPDDGVMGQRTRTALVQALDPNAAELSIEGAIRALNAKLCQE
ncbi:hypothetical protein [Paracoccus sp. PARArs4]|uniref:peptidoglycan-binding domain-containing protein n=1 Tax=Paracoccus sp. PARArs4 TaxID=2853442 RepID=UPI0024A6F950|nr:hypothetical protein [Paracoccus sp. PARArs4]